MVVLRPVKRVWAATVHTVAGMLLAVVTSSLIQTAAIYSLVASAVVWSPAAREPLLLTARLCSAVQRARFAGLLGVELVPPAPGNRAAGWRQVVYHLIAGFLISIVGGALLLSLWGVAGALCLIPVFSGPESNLFGLRLSDPVMRFGLIALGVAVAFAACVLARALAALDTAAARVMLQPSRAEELAARVAVLTESRADVVDAADAERRRIERDLHDGAQQRLVSLAMNLGIAREQLSDVDPRVRAAIEHAHDEAKQALSELRQLVRGLHPAILEDRGLDAALSGVVARSPVPARLTVDVRRRPSATVEAVAYFMVAEALSNVAKHARASAVEVVVRREADRLHVTVRDDGVGGADALRGTGLRGLGQRVSSVDGSLSVHSPAGGPTVITAELPCES